MTWTGRTKGVRKLCVPIGGLITILTGNKWFWLTYSRMTASVSSAGSDLSEGAMNRLKTFFAVVGFLICLFCLLGVLGIGHFQLCYVPTKADCR